MNSSGLLSKAGQSYILDHCSFLVSIQVAAFSLKTFRLFTQIIDYSKPVMIRPYRRSCCMYYLHTTNQSTQVLEVNLQCYPQGGLNELTQPIFYRFCKYFGFFVHILLFYIFMLHKKYIGTYAFKKATKIRLSITTKFHFLI